MALPSTFRRLVAQRLTTDFRKAVEIVTEPMIQPGPKDILLKMKYAGINASDINFTAGRYGVKDTPFGVGLEGVGEVVSVGTEVKSIKPGQFVGHITSGSFSEYQSIPANQAFPIPDLKPEYLSLLVSGLTAAIGLEQTAEIKSGDKVLVTAAAGALGQIVDLGCDFVINYKEENFDKLLKDKYPDGVDVIWETIGGSVFQTLSNRLAIKGRLVIIGAITGYKTEGKLPAVDLGTLPMQLLTKSASIRGFLVLHFTKFFGKYFVNLVKDFGNGNLKLNMDDGSHTPEGKFVGLEGALRAVDHLHTGKSTGKVYVTIQ